MKRVLYVCFLLVLLMLRSCHCLAFPIIFSHVYNISEIAIKADNKDYQGYAYTRNFEDNTRYKASTELSSRSVVGRRDSLLFLRSIVLLEIIVLLADWFLHIRKCSLANKTVRKEEEDENQRIRKLQERSRVNKFIKDSDIVKRFYQFILVG